MIRLYDTGAYLLNGTELIEDNADAAARLLQALGAQVPSKEEAAKNTDAIRFSVTITRPEIWKS